MANYSNENYTLTEKEQNFIQKFLENNGCCALTPEDLLSDNFSCQTIEDLRDCTGFSKHQIAGLLSSLIEKQVIFVEDKRGFEYNPRGGKGEKLPDLYWVDDNYLETLDPNLEF